MIASNLFDLVSAFGDGSPSQEEISRTGRAIAIILESSLSDWKQIREFEAEAGPSPWDDPAKAAHLSREIYLLHESWAKSAEDILNRVRKIPLAPPAAAQVEALADALGRTRARLLHTPEKQARAFEQVRSGQVVPAKELRDDLNARLRARREIPMAGA